MANQKSLADMLSAVVGHASTDSLTANALSSFTLGDAIAFIGIILAVWQLARGHYLLVWRIDVRYRVSILVMVAIGYLCPLLAALRANNPIEALGIKIDAGHLQLGGYIFISLAFVELFRLMTRGRGRLFVARSPFDIFNGYNIKRFHRYVFQSMLMRRFEVVTDVVLYNLDSLLYLAQQARRTPGEATSNPEYVEFACEILQEIFTDKELMQYIVEERIDFLIAYKNAEVRYQKVNSIADLCYAEISKALFVNPKSLLYRQIEEYRGASRAVNVYALFYADLDLVRRVQLINTGITWKIHKAGLDIDHYAEVLIRATELAMQAYVLSPDLHSKSFSNLKSGIKELLEITEFIAFWERYRDEARKKFDSPAGQAYSHILRFMRDLLDDALRREGSVLGDTPAELSAVRGKGHGTHSFVELIASSHARLLECVVGIRQNDDDLRRDSIELLFQFPHIDHPLVIRYHELLYEELFEKISDNIKGGFPVVLRAVLSVFAQLRPTDASKYDKPTLQAWRTLKNLLKKDIMREVLSDAKMLNETSLKRDELLPYNVIAKKYRGSINYYHVDSRGRQTRLSL